MILPFIFIHKKVYKELRNANSDIIQQYFFAPQKSQRGSLNFRFDLLRASATQ